MLSHFCDLCANPSSLIVNVFPSLSSGLFYCILHSNVAGAVIYFESQSSHLLSNPTVPKMDERTNAQETDASRRAQVFPHLYDIWEWSS